MRNVLTMVLGGGRGTRLYPLTKFRSKPAVPLGGKYRLIDIPLSNCVNSGLTRIYVLTQFNSVSLHRHIRRTYNFDNFSDGFVEILAAQQTNEGLDWYQGTADAVRKNLRSIQQPNIDHTLILSGDQLYRMDFREMLETHQSSRADITIAVLPVDRAQASQLGILRVDDTGRVRKFSEKPKTPSELDAVLTDPAWIDSRGIASRGRDCLASMGIYLFRKKVLIDLLEKTSYQDFGKEIFPHSLKELHIQAHLFDGYWEDIGTIDAFYRANLDLADPQPPFALSSAVAPLYTRSRYLPPTVMDGATIRRSLVADGCAIGSGTVIENSVIGLRCQIGRNVTIRNSILMGSDFYETPDELARNLEAGDPPLGIGDGTFIEQAIVDKNCHIGRQVLIHNKGNILDSDETVAGMIRDGIVVIHRGAVLRDGWQADFKPQPAPGT